MRKRDERRLIASINKITARLLKLQAKGISNDVLGSLRSLGSTTKKFFLVSSNNSLPTIGKHGLNDPRFEIRKTNHQLGHYISGEITLPKNLFPANQEPRSGKYLVIVIEATADLSVQECFNWLSGLCGYKPGSASALNFLFSHFRPLFEKAPRRILMFGQAPQDTTQMMYHQSTKQWNAVGLSTLNQLSESAKESTIIMLFAGPH